MLKIIVGLTDSRSLVADEQMPENDFSQQNGFGQHMDQPEEALWQEQVNIGPVNIYKNIKTCMYSWDLNSKLQ